MAFPLQITNADGTLVLNQIQSENFIAGNDGQGWRLSKDGTIEANSLIIRTTELELTGGTLLNLGSGTFDPIDLVTWQLGNFVFYNFRGVATAAGSGAGVIALNLPFTLVNSNSAGRQLTQLAQFSYSSFTGAAGTAALPFGTGAGTVLSAAGGLTQFRTEDGAFLRGGHVIINSQLIVHGFGITT